MEKITETIVDSYKNIQRQLKTVDFKRFLEIQMKEYKLTKYFLETYQDYIDMDVSKFDIDLEGIKYLISINKFNFDTWKNSNPRDLDPLLDPEFAKHFTKADIEDILQNAKFISQAVMMRFINTVSSETKKELLLHYSGPEFAGYFNAIVTSIPVLQQDVFNIVKANNDIKKPDSTILALIFNGGAEVSINLLLELLNRVYIPKRFKSGITTRSLKLTTNVNPSSEDCVRARYNLTNILERYTDDVVGEIITLVNYYDQRILLDKELLTRLLAECDLIPEDCLYGIRRVFISTGCQDKLLDYAKNNNYKSLVASLTLGK